MKWQIYGENEKKGKYLEDENKSLFLFLSFSVICDLGYHLFKVMHSSLCSGHILVVSTPWSPPPSPEVVGGTGARRRPGYGGQTVAPSCGGRFNRGGTSVKSISETWGTNESNLGKKWCREYWPGMTSYFGNKRANSPRWQSCKKDECVTQLQQFRITKSVALVWSFFRTLLGYLGLSWLTMVHPESPRQLW